MDVNNSAHDQLNRGRGESLYAFAPENLVSRDRFSRPVPLQPARSPHRGYIPAGASSNLIAGWGRIGMVANNPARDQLNTEIDISLTQIAPENLVLRDRFARPIPRQPAHSSHNPGSIPAGAY